VRVAIGQSAPSRKPRGTLIPRIFFRMMPMGLIFTILLLMILTTCEVASCESNAREVLRGGFLGRGDGGSVPLDMEVKDLEIRQGQEGQLSVFLENRGILSLNNVTLTVSMDRLSSLDEGGSEELDRDFFRFSPSNTLRESWSSDRFDPDENVTITWTVWTHPDAPTGEIEVTFILYIEGRSYTTDNGQLPGSKITISQRTPLIPGFDAGSVLLALAVVCLGVYLVRRRPLRPVMGV